MGDSTTAARAGGTRGVIVVHYWAGAKAAAGTGGDDIEVEGPISLAEVVKRAIDLHPGTRLPDVLQVCSVLVGDRPVGADDPAEVLVAPGSRVEFLPPFAGG